MKIQETEKDPNHVLPPEHDHKNLHKTPHGKRIFGMALLTVALVVGSVFAANGTKDLLRIANCRANPDAVKCQEKRTDKKRPLDPRCEQFPDHERCQMGDPVGEEPPLPPTDPGNSDFSFSGNVTDKDGFKVPAGEVWTFDPTKDTTVEVSANVIVEGVLEMRPNPGVNHTLRFTNIVESDFIGGGTDVVEGDVGLWVMGDGILDFQGEDKVAWGTDWQDNWAGDEVYAAPNTEGSRDFKKITAASQVPVKNKYGYKTELMNLTRNVNVEGTPTGRTHIFIRSNSPQMIKDTTIRYVAPEFDSSTDQSGRYGLHFHHGGEGSRGSVVEGVVIRDAGNHAFVPHLSHGITFRDTIAYDTTNGAYWWDPNDTGVDNNTDDTLFDHTIAAKTKFQQGVNDSGNGVYQLNAGDNNTITNSVAVGYELIRSVGSAPGAETDISGYSWLGTRLSDGSVWGFTNNLSHNAEGHGLRVWQNSGNVHVISDYTAYFNDRFGVSHGAYHNQYTYTNLELWGNKDGAIQSNANSTQTTHQTFTNINGDGRFSMDRHVLPPGSATIINGCNLPLLSAQETQAEGWYEFNDCKFGTVDLSGLHKDTQLTVNGEKLR